MSLMCKTPQKVESNQFNSLREKIQSKLSGSKIPSNIKEKNILIQQMNIKNSSKKKVNPNLLHSYYSNYNSITKQDPLETRSNHIQGQVKHTCKNKLKITENNILEYQSLENKNFYGFDQWIEFNKKFFSHVDQNTLKSFWKILRIINYGDVLIPSGLIFQISKVLSFDQKSKQNNLKNILNQFLKFNNTTDQVQNFRELKMYPQLQQIQSIYQKIKIIQNSDKKSINKRPSSDKKISHQKNIYQRLFQNSKIHQEERKSKIYRSMLQQRMNQQCFFQPKINQYYPQEFSVNQTFRPERICHSSEKWRTNKDENLRYQEEFCFKAKEFDRSKFQNQSLDEIPGVSEHIRRKKSSQAQQRRIERFLQKPTLVFKHY